MARGFESKSVESNRQDAEEERASRGSRQRVDIHEIERRQKREGLELSRRRIVREIEAATDERRRTSLKAALAHLDGLLDGPTADVNALNLAAVANLHLNRLDAAARQLRDALTLAPGHPTLIANLRLVQSRLPSSSTAP
jgi:hypothetical protein